MMMIKLIMIMIKEQVKNNQMKNIRQKKSKNMIQNQIYQNLMKEIREKINYYLKGCKPPTKGYDDDLVDTDNYQDTNN